jgi:hypothetical protein
MEKQTITNGIDTYSITKDEALKIELKINLLKDKKYWKGIGDKLYDFHSKDINNNINVTNDQHKVMLRLLMS